MATARTATVEQLGDDLAELTASRDHPRDGQTRTGTASRTAGRPAPSAILENPRYTGYRFFGRWAKHETLLDPDDVAAGHVIRFRRAKPDRIVRSRTLAHPEIISVEDFTEAQLLRRSRAAGGLAASHKLERGPKKTKRVYRLRGRVRCGYCTRRMKGTPREKRIYYRCSARSLVPGSPSLNAHPKNVYLPEAAVIGSLNHWLGELFAPEHVDQTVAALVASQHQGGNGKAHSARQHARNSTEQPRRTRSPTPRCTR